MSYDDSAGRFTPKNAMGAAAETLDKLHAAKEDAEKSDLYKKMQSGDPKEIFDAAEQFGKVFTQLAEGPSHPRKSCRRTRCSSKTRSPPLPDDAKALALEVAAATKDWYALLKRSFHTLKADGPFIFERAEVNATAIDRLASAGDPPSRLRLTLVRFRLEGIDSGWKVISIRRVLPGDAREEQPSCRDVSSIEGTTPSPGETPLACTDAPARSDFDMDLGYNQRGSSDSQSSGRVIGAISSVVRAPALHAGCRGFESLIAHSHGRLVAKPWNNPHRGWRSLLKAVGCRYFVFRL